MASAWFQFRALFRKNLLGMKRNIIMSIIEVTFPIVLLMVGHFVRVAFTREHNHYKDQYKDNEYRTGAQQFFIDKSIMSFNPDILNATYNQLAYMAMHFPEYNLSNLQKFSDSDIHNLNKKIADTFNTTDLAFGKWDYLAKTGDKYTFVIPTYKGFSIKPIVSIICAERKTIAYVGTAFDPEDTGEFNCKTDTLLCNIARSISVIDPNFTDYHFKKFENITEMNDYVEAHDYGDLSKNKPEICFGISAFKDAEKKYRVNLHYFDNYILEGKKLNFYELI